MWHHCNVFSTKNLGFILPMLGMEYPTWDHPQSWCSLQTLRWRHNDHDGVSNHQPHGCLLNRLFRRRSKKTSKLRVTDLCAGNSPGPVNSPHKGPVTRKMFPFDDVIMKQDFLFLKSVWVVANNILSCINSSPPSASHICQWTGSALVQIMTCGLFGTKPLFQSMVGYCQLNP